MMIAVEERNEILTGMMPYFYKRAHIYARKYNQDVDELVSVAVERVLEKFDRFDPSRGLKPLTYFGMVAERTIQIYCRRDNVIVLPQNQSTLIEASQENVQRLKGTASLDAKRSGDSGSLYDCVGQSQTPLEIIEQADDINTVQEALKLLTERERVIVMERAKCATYRDIGRILGLSGQRIQQLEPRATKKLRWILKRLMRATKEHRLWMPQEIERFELLAKDSSIQRAAAALNRSLASAYNKARSLGIRGAWHAKLWTPDGDEFIRTNRHLGWVECARRLGKTPAAIRTRAVRLGIQFKMLNTEDLARLRVMHSEGLTTFEAGLRLGVSGECVRYTLRRLGLKSNKRNEEKRMVTLRATLFAKYGTDHIPTVRKIRIREQVATLGYGDIDGRAAVCLEALVRLGGSGNKHQVAAQIATILEEKGWKWMRGGWRAALTGMKILRKEGRVELVGGGGTELYVYALVGDVLKSEHEKTPVRLCLTGA